MSGTSSARPDELIAYSTSMYVESEVVLGANQVRAEMDAFLASSGTYMDRCYVDVEETVEVAVRLAQELDVWVGAVGQAFLLADGGREVSVNVADADIIAHLPPGMADPPAESRRKAEEGADLFEQLRRATDERDHDAIEDLLEQLAGREDDMAFLAGFVAAAEDALGDMDALEGMIQDGMRPKKRGGPFGPVVDFLAGAWDATWGTLTFLEGLTTRVLYDPGAWADNWGSLGSGLWHGITNPGEFVKAIVNWEGLLDNPARWLGEFVPDLALTVFTGGAGATRRGADALDAASDLGRAGRRIDDLGDLGDIGRATPAVGLVLDEDLARVSRAMRDSLVAKGLPEGAAERVANRITSGTQFNRNSWDRYPFNEVRLTTGKVLDSYDPVRGEIVSRKHTQLSDVTEATARRYIDELANKYSEGIEVATSPSVLEQQRRTGVEIAGRPLEGQMILEVPSQVRSVPPEVLEHAARRQIVIRTVDGLVLTP